LSLADLYPDGAMAEKIRPKQRPFESRVDDNVEKIGSAWAEQGTRMSKEDKARYRQALKNKAARGHFG
jgi:hypothetical protein